MSSRRASGEGSISRRRSGKYQGALRLPDGRRKYVYGDSREEIRRKLHSLIHAREMGTLADARGVSVGEFLDQWLEEVVKPNVRPWTYSGYEVHVRLHLKPSLGRIPLEKLTPMDVQKLINQKASAGLSPKSIRYIRGTLRSALNHALRWNLVSRNVAALATTPRVEQYEIKPLTPVEARQFLASIKEDRLEALYSVALTMGLRQGETLGLRWRDVDLALGYLRVSKQLQRIDGRLQLVEPKTGRSRRTIAMPPSIVVALRAHRERQNLEKRLAGDRWADADFIFTGAEGHPLDGSAISKQFPRLLERAGLERRRFHDLRHSCATLLLAQGVSPRVVMDVLGHSQISLTMNTYAHVIPELRRESADRMESVIQDLF